MNPDTLRTAIEQADGFARTKTSEGRIQYTGPMPYHLICDYDVLPPQWFIDALAAQLVRQVDALIPKPKCSVHDFGTIVFVTDKPKGEKILRGTDRSENTISAIVESGVLEK